MPLVCLFVSALVRRSGLVATTRHMSMARFGLTAALLLVYVLASVKQGGGDVRGQLSPLVVFFISRARNLTEGEGVNVLEDTLVV